MGQNVFVYGSLMFPSVYEGVTGHDRQMMDAILFDHRRYAVCDPNGSSYPGMIPETGHSVTGKLLSDISEAELAALDRFEEIDRQLYNRVSVVISTDPGPIRALAYMAGSELRPYLRGEWDPQEFAETKLSAYLRTVVEQFRKEQQ